MTRIPKPKAHAADQAGDMAETDDSPVFFRQVPFLDPVASRPLFIAGNMSGIFFASARMSIIVCSATDAALAAGVVLTTIPRSLARSISIIRGRVPITEIIWRWGI